MMEEIILRENERIDDLQRNGYRIIQNGKKFCFGMDAVLLSGFVAENGNRVGNRVIDLGTGTGIIPILLAAKTEAKSIVGLEIQSESADMAARSVGLNGLKNRIEIVEGDICKADALFPAASFDSVTCNPPYMIGQHGIQNGADAMTIARHEVLCTFDDIARVAAKLLKPGGSFYLVHRPFRLPELIRTLSNYKLEPKRMQLVYPFVDAEPNMVLIEAVRGGRPRLTMQKPIIVYREKGVYTEEIMTTYGY